MREAKVAECVRRNHSTLVVVLYHQLIIRGHSSTSSTMMQWLIDTTRRYPSAFYREATERPTDVAESASRERLGNRILGYQISPDIGVLASIAAAAAASFLGRVEQPHGVH